MIPSINNDNFSEPNKNNQTDNDWDNISHSKDPQRMDGRIDDRDKDRYSDDRDTTQTGEPNKKVDNSWDAESKTDNQDEDDWEAENEKAKTSNEGTKDNDWDANNPVERSTRSNDLEEDEVYLAADDYDYISSDHSNYHLSNDRYRWNDED